MAVISFTVDIVTLAVLPIDHFVGDVTGVAHALPTDAVPQPGTHDGTIVLPAVSLQLLAATALRLALTVLPNVARLTPGMMGEGLHLGVPLGWGHLSFQALQSPKHL